MAVPSIASITPSAGHTGGRTLVEIAGSNFRLPTVPPATGPTTAPPPSVRVTIGGRRARSVEVASATLLRVLTPIHDPSGTPADPGAGVDAVPASDVVVENVDDAGVLIPGETATLTEAFSFVRPRYDVECHLEHAIKSFVLELKRQVLDNVSWNPHTDFDPLSGGSFLDLDNPDETQRSLAFLPGIALIDIELTDSVVHGTDEQTELALDETTWIARRAPLAQDLTCTLACASDNSGELVRLLQAMKLFFRKNRFLEVLRDAADQNGEAIRYEMTFGRGQPVRISGRAANNVETFSGQVTIKGILLEEIPGLPTASVPGAPADLPGEPTLAKGRTLNQIVLQRQQR